MAQVLLDMAMSLDGYIAGPDGADWGLHDWFFEFADDGLPVNPIARESILSLGAIVMGRTSYGMGDDSGGFGQTTYKIPHFILTHHAHESIVQPGDESFHFITEGLESAIEQAKAAAGERVVAIGGGASVAQQALQLGLVDEIQVHVIPAVFGRGLRLFEALPERIRLEKLRVVDAEGVTHLKFRVVNQAAP